QVDPAGVTFIDVHTLYGFTNEFRDWDPTVDLHGHLVLGFDQRGVSVWNRNPYRQVSLLANRAEILGLATVTVDSGRSIAYALELTLAARVGPGRVRFYVLKDGGHGFPQDEYAVNQAIGKASRALGPLPEATTSRTVPR
ncbi:MAG: hypothetical protein JWP75_365, partial [Frondihabitans sp.]|nr:hypothetical protein [Frondihabitans sp.]